jgi:hypothetical protein
MIKFLGIVVAYVTSLLSMNFLAFKAYHWFKPYTGEQFSGMLPDLSFWQIFALIIVLRYITGVASSTATIMSTLSRVTKKDGDDTDILIQLSTSVIIPWVALLLLYLIRIIVF